MLLNYGEANENALNVWKENEPIILYCRMAITHYASIDKSLNKNHKYKVLIFTIKKNPDSDSSYIQ